MTQGRYMLEKEQLAPPASTEHVLFMTGTKVIFCRNITFIRVIRSLAEISIYLSTLRRP